MENTFKLLDRSLLDTSRFPAQFGDLVKKWFIMPNDHFIPHNVLQNELQYVEYSQLRCFKLWPSFSKGRRAGQKRRVFFFLKEMSMKIQSVAIENNKSHCSGSPPPFF